MKNKDLALRVAGIVFLFGAVGNFLRLLLRIKVAGSGSHTWMYMSLISFAVSLTLAIWMFTASKK